MPARVIAQQWISLNGYASGVTGEGEIFAAVPPEADAQSMAYNGRLLASVSAVLLGRRCYEEFSEFWPEADVPIAERVNTVPKVVFSRTLSEAPWGRFAPAQVEPDAFGFVRGHRENGAGDLLLWGSLDLQAGLLGAGLIDELDLFVAPVALPAGTPLLPVGTGARLDLIEAETWSPVVHLRYAVSSP